MALWKRSGGQYYADFTVDGKRYRPPLGTKDEREAKRLEKVKITEASQGKLAASKREFSRLGFKEAAERYIEETALTQVPQSVRTNKERSRGPIAYFKNTALGKITADDLRAYVIYRKNTPTQCRPKGLSNRTINMEVAFLLRVMRRAKLSYRFADEMKPLPERHDVGRALSVDEKARLVKTAGAKLDWQNVRRALVLSLNSTMRKVEIRNLQWLDIDLMDWTVSIRRAGTKTDAGERIIPLNGDAQRVILELRDQAKTLFGEPVSPDWYLFPRSAGYSVPDPTRPMGGWTTAWRALRKKAADGDPAKGIAPMPSLAKFRFHDLRHHAITELAESQTSDSTIKSIAGHVSQKMLDDYSHVRIEAKRRALDALSSRPGGSYVTSHVTKAEFEGLQSLQVVEKAGGDDGTRTRDLMRDRHAF
jgi:integrase